MSEIRFDGQVAIVTGAGGGLGRAYALELAARGANVVVNDLATPDGSSADAVVAEIRETGGTAVAAPGSVCEAAESIVEIALAAFGRVDVLINNAGILRDRSFLKLTPGDIDDVLDVHLRGAFAVTRPAFAAMKEAGYGRIVFTTSSVGLFGNFGQTNYAAAKLGLVGLARSLAVEGARAGIGVNVVAPSAATAMTGGMFRSHTERFAPERVVPMTVFLASRDCTETGQIYWAGGGRFAKVEIRQTAGWVADGAPTAETVRDHLTEIADPSQAFTPANAMEELKHITSTLGIDLGL